MFGLIRDMRPLLARDDRRQWVLLLAAALASGLSKSLFLALINAAIAEQGGGRLPLYAGGAMALIGLMLATDVFVRVRGRAVSMRMSMRLRRRLVDGIGAANLQFLEREGIGSLQYHLTHTIGVIAATYGTLLTFASALVTLLFNFIYVGWLSPLGLAAALLITLVGVSVHWRYERLNRQHRRRTDQLGNTNDTLHYAYLHGYKELRLSRDKAADYRGQMDALNDELLREVISVSRMSATGGMATNLFQYLAIAAIGLLLPALTASTPIVAMQLLAAILFTIGPLTGVVDAFGAFGAARVSLDNVKRLSAEIEATRETAGAADRADLPPFESLTLRQIAFKFAPAAGGQEEDFRLGPVDLTIKRGEVVCVVGGNGSGKTVLIRLLTGLYRPVSGQLLYNGTPLGDGDRQAYREQFSSVFSDFYLFAELLGQRDTPAPKVAAWLEYFGLSGKTGFANGRFSNLALSTGQRKRLALAVALLDERPILVLDEFGAEQDPDHRHQFYREWLPELRRLDKTVIVVSHDDHYFDAADRIVRMDFGRVVEDRRADVPPPALREPVAGSS